jgi:hypothetical protein
MTTLAKERHPPGQKPAMITSMNFVAVQAVLWNRHMLKCKGSSLFGMAFITELVYRISLDHRFDVKSTHRVMAT